MTRRATIPAMVLALGSCLALGSAPAEAQGGNAYPDPSFQLVNRTGEAVEHLFANPAELRDWGHDRLARAVPPGGRVRIRLDPRGGCLQDIRVVYAGGGVQDLRGLDTCARPEVVLGRPAAAGPGQAGPASRAARLALRNDGRRPIVDVFVSPAGQPDWGYNRLTVSPLPPGGGFRLDLPPGGCLYDVKVVYFDGMPQEQRGLDLCARPAVRFP